MKRVYFLGGIFVGLLFFAFSFVYAQTAEEYVHLGNVSGREDKNAQAVLDYTKAIDAKPDYANAYYNRAYVYIKMRKYKLAISDLDDAIGIDPKYSAAYHVRGIAYFFRKKYVQAISDYNKAIELDPNNVKIYVSRLSANFKLGYSDRAWEDVIKIQQLGGSVNPAIINILKGKKYKDKI